MINIQNNVIVLDAEKTATKVKRGTVTVPLNAKAKAIIEKYFPKNGDSNTPIFNEIAPTNQRANNTIRKVLSELPLLQEEKVVRQYYLKDYEETLIRKCDKISWHSSRRTFVNLLVQRGASPQELKSMTGWVDIKTLTNYMATMKKDSEKAISMINDF